MRVRRLLDCIIIPLSDSATERITGSSSIAGRLGSNNHPGDQSGLSWQCSPSRVGQRTMSRARLTASLRVSCNADTNRLTEDTIWFFRMNCWNAGMAIVIIQTSRDSATIISTSVNPQHENRYAPAVVGRSRYLWSLLLLFPLCMAPLARLTCIHPDC